MLCDGEKYLERPCPGSILSPLPFSVFIDDLSDECENQLYLLAAYSTLFDSARAKSTDDPKANTTSLNRDLEKMRSGQAGGK